MVEHFTLTTQPGQQLGCDLQGEGQLFAVTYNDIFMLYSVTVL